MSAAAASEYIQIFEYQQSSARSTRGKGALHVVFMGRHKPVPGGLAAAVQAADTHENNRQRSLGRFVVLCWYSASDFGEKCEKI